MGLRRLKISLRNQAKQSSARDERQPTYQCMLSISRLLGMLSEHTSESAGDHVEESASNMGEQYAQPECGY